MAQQFFERWCARLERLGLLSDEHFTVDGTLIEAAASLKSFGPKDRPPSDLPPDDRGNPTVNFRGEKRRTQPPEYDQSRSGIAARAQRTGKSIEQAMEDSGADVPARSNR